MTKHRRIDSEHELRLAIANISSMNKAETVAAYRSMLDGCQAEGRSLTGFEERLADEYQKHLDRLGKQPAPARGIDQRSEPGSRINSDRAPLGYQTSNGRFIRAIGRDERLSDADQSLPEGVNLGDVMRAMATGRWDSASREMATVSGSIDSNGGVLLNPQMSRRLIDLARNRMVTLRAGAQTLPMETADMILPSQLSDPSGYWRREGTAITLSDPTFGRTTLNAKTLGCLTAATVELVEDSPLVGQAIENSMAQALAVELDRAMLRGTGAAEPLGLRYWSNAIPTTEVAINTIDKSSATWTFDDLVTGCQYVEEDNFEVNGIIVSPATMAKRRKLKDGDGQWLAHPFVDSLPWYSTKQIPSNLGSGTNESEIYLGDWRELVLGMRAEIRLEVFRMGSAGSTNAVSQMLQYFRAYLRADCAVLRGGAFTIIYNCLA